jgi:hypothetical protein
VSGEPIVPQLPASRQLVRGGLDLGAEAARRLRGASIYVAFVMLGLLGPLVVAGIAITAADPAAFDLDLYMDPAYDPFADPSADAAAAPLGFLSLGFLVAAAGIVAMIVESQAMATAILAGVALDRPVSTGEALRRSRQVFWQLVGYALITALPISIVTQVVATILGAFIGEAFETIALTTTILAAILGLPFVYGVTAIVLGEVGPVEAARRSIRLARARWRLAIVISLVATAAVYLGVFAYLGALGVIGTLTAPLGVGVGDGLLPSIVAIGLGLALSAAFGSLLLTVTAIVVAPQVIAFLGLTHYSGGLERARDSTVLRPAERWLTLPMVLGLVLVALSAVAAVASLGAELA